MDYLVNYSFLFSIISMIFYIAFYIFKKEKVAFFVSLSFLISFILFALYFLYYSFKANRFPLSNQYESVMLLTLTVYMITFYYYFKNKKNIESLKITIILFPLLLGLLNLIDPTIKPLMPALRSNWLIFHVLTAMISYSFFLISGVYGIILFRKYEKEKEEYILNLTKSGFFMLTLGIITGAVWAEDAWGRYWSWDPKETWSLITWFYYAMILHLRKNYLKEKHFAISLFIGLLFVIFTYFGVNYLLPGLHSYA